MEKLKGDMLELILSSTKGRLTERCTKFIIFQVNALCYEIFYGGNFLKCFFLKGRSKKIC